jgi:four helix bundle protein
MSDGSANGRAAVKSYRELIAWQKAMDLVEAVYAATRAFPDIERYGLASQLQRSAVSVPSNIAEGQGRRSTKELLQHLAIAHGSLCEMETQLLIAQRLEYLEPKQADALLIAAAEVGRLIQGLSRALANR